MNYRCYRLVFSKLRGMLVAVSETAIGHGNSGHGETRPTLALQCITLFAMRHAAFATLALFGLAPVLADAQIVPSGAHAPNVISTGYRVTTVLDKIEGSGEIRETPQGRKRRFEKKRANGQFGLFDGENV